MLKVNAVIIINIGSISIHVLIYTSIGASHKEYMVVQAPITPSMNSLWEMTWETDAHTIVLVRETKRSGILK